LRISTMMNTMTMMSPADHHEEEGDLQEVEDAISRTIEMIGDRPQEGVQEAVLEAVDVVVDLLLVAVVLDEAETIWTWTRLMSVR